MKNLKAEINHPKITTIDAFFWCLLYSLNIHIYKYTHTQTLIMNIQYVQFLTSMKLVNYLSVYFTWIPNIALKFSLNI